MITSNFTRKIKNEITFSTDEYTSNFLAGVDLASTKTNLKLSAVYRCVNLLSDDFGRLPFFCVNANTNEKNKNERAYYLLNIKPNKLQVTPFNFKKYLEVCILLKGNAYALIKTNLMGVDEELIVIDPDCVSIVNNNNEIFYDINEEGKTKRYNSDEIIHLKGLSVDGFEGQSVLSYARNTIENGLNLDEYSNNFLRRGGRPQAILQTEANLSTKKIQVGNEEESISLKEAMRNEWEHANSGNSNANRVAICDLGLKYVPIPQISQRDMMFVESKEITVGDICRFFGVPPYMLGIGKESYASNEQNMINYINQNFASIATQAEQEFSYKLLSDVKLKKGLRIKANLNVMLRGDTKTRIEYYAAGRRDGWLSPNDIRDKEDMEKIDGGDIYYASLNYIPLDKFSELSESRNKGVQNK